jgi:hypothetical protein
MPGEDRRNFVIVVKDEAGHNGLRVTRIFSPQVHVDISTSM